MPAGAKFKLKNSRSGGWQMSCGQSSTYVLTAIWIYAVSAGLKLAPDWSSIGPARAVSSPSLVCCCTANARARPPATSTREAGEDVSKYLV